MKKKDAKTIDYKELQKLSLKAISICEDRFYIRVYNIDDTANATVNLNNILTVGYKGDSGYVDVTSLLSSGSNKISFNLYNYGGGYTWGFEIKKNNEIIFHEEAGSAGVYGANENDQTKTYQYVYDKDISVDYCLDVPNPLSSPATTSDIPPQNALDNSNTILSQETYYLSKTPELSFNDIPQGVKVTSGSVTVIYKNDNMLRIPTIKTKNKFLLQSNKDKNYDGDGNNGHGDDEDKCDSSNPGRSKADCDTTIRSSDPKNAKKVNEILRKYNIKAVSDIAYPNLSESELNEDQKIASDFYNIDFPHRKSCHIYQFPDSSDTQKIAEELRSLPFVLSAYQTPEISASGDINVDKLGSNTKTFIPKPTDYGFSNGGKDYYWWLSKHRVFEAWDIYGNTPSPRIAILDSGFDTSSSAIDKPNYESGVSVRYEPQINKYESKNGDVFEIIENFPKSYSPAVYDDREFSHGTAVASILASPKNGLQSNSNTWLSGVAPGATIFPVRIRNKHSSSTGMAISKAVQEKVDAINMSLGISGRPASFSPAIRIEVATAIAKNIPVIIAAGNSGDNNDPLVNCGKNINTDVFYVREKNGTCSEYKLDLKRYPDSGEIIVGGSESNSYDNGTHAWISSTFGSRVHVTAGASDINVPHFNPLTGSRSVTSEDGTSLAAPMVSGVVAMIRKMSSYKKRVITPLEIRNIISYSGNFGKYYDGKHTNIEERFLGAFPKRNPFSSTQNMGSLVSIRDLNAYNALLIADNLYKYDAVTRVFNIDDYVQSTFNSSWGNWYAWESINRDTVYGVKNLILNKDYINFRTYNTSINRGVTYGYQVYRGLNFSSGNVEEYSAGLSGVVGSDNNKPRSVNTWYGGWSYRF